MSLLSGLLLYAMIRNDLLSYRILPGWSAAAAACLLVLTGVFTSLRYWMVRHGKYDVVGRALVFQGFGRAAVPVALGLAQAGWIGLLLGEITSRVLGIGRMMRAAWPAIRSSVRPFSPEYFRSVLRRNWKSPGMLLPSSLIDALAVMIPLPVISYLFDASAAGQFFLVQRLSSLPAGLIATSVADVFHPTIANAHWNEPGQVRAILLEVTRKLALASAGIYLPVALVSPFVFGLLFGDEWHAAGICMAIYAPLSMVSLVVSPVSRLLLVVDKIELKFIIDLTNLILPNIGMFGLNYFGYGFFPCVAVYVAFSSGALILYYWLIWRESVAIGMRHK
jgi:O-antigen/teichoic acid export membrane protein